MNGCINDKEIVYVIYKGYHNSLILLFTGENLPKSLRVLGTSGNSNLFKYLRI